MNNTKILSDITIFEKYARYQEELGRRENWTELVNRNMDMHIKRYPKLASKIAQIYTKFVLPMKVLPSMRSLQFGGQAIELNHSRIYNCAFVNIDHYSTFGEVMFLLLGGTGKGYSVQSIHTRNLGNIYKPKEDIEYKYVVPDSIEGWAQCINELVKSYYIDNRFKVKFDFSQIREKGMPLITAGGKAPGPEPLKICVSKITSIFDNALSEGRNRLKNIEIHDICCHIADAVLAGGIRRAALISLFDADDKEMLSCKSGNWWELNPQRGRANNSWVGLRTELKYEQFRENWLYTKNSNAGEPGCYLTNNIDLGTNPCAEIALNSNQFCNLTEINVSNLESEVDFFERCEAAAFIGTLQAGYTDFHYLRPIWRKQTQKEALLGVSMTGIASNKVFNYDINYGAQIVVNTNKAIANVIGINPAARTTCVKPAGTTSLVLGTSSGIHAWHNDYYIRRMRIQKSSELYTYINDKLPHLLEDEYFSPSTVSVLSIPIKAPDNATLRFESPFNLLERVKVVNDLWVKGGHVYGENTHNVSATVSLKENEWEEAIEWMWNNKNSFNGLSVLPYDGGTYKQAPFEDITKEQYEKMSKELSLDNFNLNEVYETKDNTNLTGELACSGGACEII